VEQFLQLEPGSTAPAKTGQTRRAFFGASVLTILGLGYAGSRSGALKDSDKDLDAAAPAPEQVTISLFNAAGQKQSSITRQTIVKPASEWRKQLSGAEFTVTRRRGTEPPYTGRYWDNHEPGLYRCVCCDTALFHSSKKFESGTGWPSFTGPVAAENIGTRTDTSFGIRIEVHCKLCEAHLGHVFSDGPAPDYLRYCLNSVSLRFEHA
jgi:peptide-methionine (R)-S-oxide reductase